MARVRVTTGTEGPRHDPYGFTEIEFTSTAGVVTTARLGLCCTLWHDGLRIADEYDDEIISERFAELTGLTITQAESIYNERVYVEDPMGPASMYV